MSTAPKWLLLILVAVSFAIGQDDDAPSIVANRATPAAHDALEPPANRTYTIAESLGDKTYDGPECNGRQARRRARADAQPPGRATAGGACPWRSPRAYGVTWIGARRDDASATHAGRSTLYADAGASAGACYVTRYAGGSTWESRRTDCAANERDGRQVRRAAVKTRNLKFRSSTQ